ncbi:MAG: TolC family protein [Bacteroidia bacterium]
MKIKLSILFFFSALLAQSQDSLSLRKAVENTLQNNYDIQLSQIAIEQAKITNTWGEAGRYPTVSLNASQSNNISDLSQNPTSFIQDILISNSVQGGANVNWILFNGFRVNATKERLEQIEHQSEGNASLVIENSLKATIIAYYSAKLQKDKLLLLQEVLRLSKDRYNYHQIRNEIGSSSSSDLLQFQQAMMTDSSNVLMQKIAYKNALRNLNLVMNQDLEKEYNLTETLPQQFSEYVYSDLKGKMLESNLSLKNEYINKELFSKDVDIAKSTMYPVVSFGAGANVSRSQFRIGDFPSIPGTNINYFASFTLSFNIFDGGKVKRAIQSLGIQQKVTDLTIEKMSQSLEKDLLEKYQTYLAQKSIFDLNTSLFSIAQKNLDLTAQRYESGLVNSFNYRDVQVAYLNAGISTLEAKFNAFITHLDLTALTGGIIDEYSK